MITLITRQEVFAKHLHITSEIAAMQRDFYDDDDCFENEQDLAAYRDMFDARHMNVSKPERWYSVITLKHADIFTYVEVLSEKLLKLLHKFGVRNLLMLGHYKMNFLGNPDNNHPPVQNAVEQFYKLTGSPNYNEAIKFDVDYLPLLLDIAFWIGRCDARAPEFIYFHDQDEKLAFYLCKYGALHLVEFGKKAFSLDLTAKEGWHFVGGSCKEQFSESSKIEGRKK
jgi:hypothetical protein